jgi:hypothetical protein
MRKAFGLVVVLVALLWWGAMSPAAATEADVYCPNNNTGAGSRFVPCPSWFSYNQASISGGNNTAGTGAVQMIAAQGANVRIYVTALQCSNSGSSNSLVTLNDGSGFTIMVAAGSVAGSLFPSPLAVAANTALTFTPGTGTSNMYCYAQGYVGP